MLISLEGDEGSGKTTLAYSGPLKIVGFAFDMGWERAIYGTQFEKLFKGLEIKSIPYNKDFKGDPAPITADITIYELPQPIQMDGTQMHGCRELWNYFLIHLGGAIQDASVRTIVIDTGTVARRVKADAHLQELQEREPDVKKRRVQLIQIEYGRPNDAIRDIWTTHAGIRKNLIMVHHLTDERGLKMNRNGEMEQVLTGRRVLEGLANTYRFADIALRVEKDGKGGVKGTWVKCGYNLSFETKSVENPTWDRLVNQIEMSAGESGSLLRLDHRNIVTTA